MIKYIKKIFADTWSETERLSIENNSTFGSKFVNIPIIVILVYIAAALSVVKYFGNTDSILSLIANSKSGKFSSWFFIFFYQSKYSIFYQKIYWICSIIIFYLIIPILIIKFGFKKKLKDFGMSFNNVYKDYPIYILMLIIMLPLVYFASKTSSFQANYPIFKPKGVPLIPIFIFWQIAYFIQFVAVEFFFRGFILHGLKNRFGLYSIFISTIPYCMVHFGKPFSETIAAILAGIVLSTFSLKSRSIVLGIIIHYSVAITMDIFALYRLGLIN